MGAPPEEQEDLRARQTQLLLAVAGGDERALEEIYDLFARPLYSLGLRWLGDMKMAEELVQEVIVRVWKGAQTFDASRGRASSWIFGVARNAATDLQRADRRKPVPVAEVIEDSPAEWDEDVVWLSWQVGQALASLPVEQQAVLELAFVNQYTHSEISRTLGVPIGTVKTRIYLGLRKLKTRLKHLEMEQSA